MEYTGSPRKMKLHFEWSFEPKRYLFIIRVNAEKDQRMTSRGDMTRGMRELDDGAKRVVI